MRADTLNARSLQTPRFWLVMALAAALGLRLLGIGFGLPLHLYPDEETQVLNAQHMLTGDLNPHFFRYSSLYIYQLFTLDSALQLPANLLGLVLGPSTYWMAARLLTSIYGTLTVWGVYLLGRAIASKWTGVVASWLVAINPEHVLQSHYATVDIAMTFWIVMALVCAVRALRRPETSWLPASAALGLAVGTKYTALVIALLVGAFLVISLYRHQGQIWPSRRARMAAWIMIGIGVALGAAVAALPIDAVFQLGKQWSTDGSLKAEYVSLLNTIVWSWRASAVASVLVGTFALFNSRARRLANALMHPRTLAFWIGIGLTFVITSPYVLLDLPIAARDILYEYRHMLLGAAAQFSTGDPLQAASYPSGIFPQPLYYVQWWLGQNGWLVAGFALLGALVLLRRAPWPDALIFISAALLALAITRAATKADRYALPLVPMIAIWSGAGVVWVLSGLRRSSILIAPVSAAVLIVPLLTTWNVLERDFLMPNTNWLAYQWVEQNVRPGSVIVREDSTPDIENATRSYRVIETQSAFEEKSLDDWRRGGVQYILVGRLRDSFYRPNALRFPQIVENYADLDENGILQARFLADTQSAGPPVWIYRLP